MNPGPATSIIPEQFVCAVVRLVSLQRERRQPGQLLFASVSLLARGRQRPPSSVGFEVAKVGRTEQRLYFRRAVLDVDAAVRWYRALGTTQGNLTPVPEVEGERDSKLDGCALSVPPLSDHPAWPRLGLTLGRDLMFTSDELAQPCPFVGSEPSRVHRRFGTGAGFQDVLDDDACIQKLKQWVHFDMSRYPEYAGSAVLVVPDPFVRRIDSFYVDNEAGGEDQILRVVPREPGGLQGLSVMLFERQAHLLSRFETHAVPADGLVTMSGNDTLGATGFVLTHELQGPLQASSATHYLRSVGFNMNIEEPARLIEAPASDSPDSQGTAYQSTLFTDRQSTSVGASRSQAAEIRIEQAAFNRRQAFDATHFEQTWLEAGDREAALNFIRSRVHRARESVLVADPYLGYRQLKQFLFAISHKGVKVTLLTSRLAFESKYAEDAIAPTSSTTPTAGASLPAAPPSRTDEFARYGALQGAIAELARHTGGDVEVWVLPGDSPELHDRFLAVDDSAWFFGGSFNGLGERASLVVRIPQPEGILEKVRGMISRALSLEAHVQMRAVLPPAPPETATTSTLPTTPRTMSRWRIGLARLLERLLVRVSGQDGMQDE
jgi:hypothetical protein